MTYSEELRQIRKDCNANGKRLDQIQAEFCETLLSKPPTKQGNVSVDPDEILAEEIYQSGRGSRGNTDASHREEASDDPDEKLAAEIFAAAGGNTGADPEATEELSPEDEALVEQLFSAGGGNRKQDKNRVSV